MRGDAPGQGAVSWYTGNRLGAGTSKQSLKDVILAPFSVEMFFALCLYAGRIKGDLEAYNLPDLTVVFAILTTLGVVFLLLRREIVIWNKLDLGFWALLVFAALASSSLAWSPGVTYAQNKALMVWVFCLFAFALSSVVIGPDPVRFRRFATALVVLGAINVLQSLMSTAGGFSSFVNELGGDYITLAYSLYTMSIILIIRAVYERNKPYILAIYVGLAVLGILYGMASGARAATAAFFAVILISIWLTLLQGFFGAAGRTITKRVSIAIPLLAAAAITAAMFVDFSDFMVVQRLRIFWETDGGGGSAEARTMFYGMALDMLKECPFLGCGIGSFPIYAGFGDIRAYPHNLFLEIGAELGSVGLFLFVVAVTPVLWLIFKRGFSSSNAAQASGLFLYTFICAMSSSDLTDNRMIFVSMGLLIGVMRFNSQNAAAQSRRHSSYQTSPAYAAPRYWPQQ